jgi:YHS domain-containing protein
LVEIHRQVLEITPPQPNTKIRTIIMNPIKTLVGGLAVTVALTSTALAAGVDVNATSTGLALRGYDPVAYFTLGEPTAGSLEHTSTYEGATYRFVSAEHKAQFDASPEAFAPQYGGYCAFGTAMGFKFDGDPEVWKIVDGELFLNLSTAVQARWEEDVPGFINTADVQWETIEDKSPEELQAQ